MDTRLMRKTSNFKDHGKFAQYMKAFSVYLFLIKEYNHFSNYEKFFLYKQE